MNRAALIASAGAAVVASAIWVAPPDYLAAYLGPADATPRPPAVKAAPVAAQVKPAIDTVPVNPLVTVTIDSLSAMVERPLFNPTRAPPPPEVAIVETEAVAEPEPAPVAEQIGPQDFTLLGVSINGGERFALVRYNKTNEVFRLKSGQFLSDWELRSVESKEIVIARADAELTIRLFDAARPPATSVDPQAEGDTETENLEQ